MQGIAYGLLVLFFAFGALKTATSYMEIKRPEAAIRMFLRFAIAKGFISYGMEILMAILEIAQGVIAQALSVTGVGVIDTITVPEGIAVAIEEANFMLAIPLWAVTFIGSLVVTVLSFTLIMTVYGKFFKFYIFAAYAPIPLSAFAGEPTQNMGTNFLKNFAVVCLEFASIALACVICSTLLSAPAAINVDSSAVNQVWGYLTEVIFNMIILVGAVKTSDRITRELMGL